MQKGDKSLLNLANTSNLPLEHHLSKNMSF